MTYQHFAYIYDKLMKDVPYPKWLEFFSNKKDLFNIDGKNVLDLACGTGSLSIPLAKLGFNVVGVDLSSEMLTVAEEKARNENITITFFQQDMSDLSGFEGFDYVVCFCDSINYLKNENDVIETFNTVYNTLNHNGLFMFDVHSIEKIQEVFLDQTFVSNEEDVSYIWNCFEGEYDYSVEHELTFFVKDSNTNMYERYDEIHEQRTFPIEFYRNLLEKSGFTSIQISSDFQGNLNSSSNERIFFCCQKK
jgi:SAM-dependent methyltransferase